MSSAKKRKIYIALVITGIILFFISMISFMVLAYNTKGEVSSTDVTIAWILLAFIVLGTLMSFIGAILYIILNKEKIKDYLKKITN